MAFLHALISEQVHALTYWCSLTLEVVTLVGGEFAVTAGPQRDPGISRDPGIGLKSRSREF